MPMERNGWVIVVECGPPWSKREEPAISLRTLIQTRHRPDRYVPSIFFDTMPSAPSWHAWANMVSHLHNALVKQDACLGVGQQWRQRSLPVQEREIAKILGIMFDQVEGVEDRGSSGLATGQLFEP